MEEAIKSKSLYVIEAPDYPKSDDEKKRAAERFEERFDESAYSLACNNCERLVSYILTGNPFSEQIRKAGAWKKLFVDGFDNYVSHGVRNLLKLSECLLPTVPFHFFIKTAVSTVVNEAKKSISWYSSSVTEQVIDRSTKHVTMHLCKQESECQFYSNFKVRQMYQCCSGCNQICSKKNGCNNFFNNWRYWGCLCRTWN